MNHAPSQARNPARDVLRHPRSGFLGWDLLRESRTRSVAAIALPLVGTADATSTGKILVVS
jgi:hypothetical protein